MQPTMLTFLSKPKAKPTKPGEEERKLRLRVTSAFSGWPIMVRIITVHHFPHQSSSHAHPPTHPLIIHLSIHSAPIHHTIYIHHKPTPTPTPTPTSTQSYIPAPQYWIDLITTKTRSTASWFLSCPVLYCTLNVHTRPNHTERKASIKSSTRLGRRTQQTQTPISFPGDSESPTFLVISYRGATTCYCAKVLGAI